MWIDNALSRPPDSLCSEVCFDHGIEGVAELVEYHRHRTGKLSTFVGFWHSHLFGQGKPGRSDKAAMTALVKPVSGGPSRALVLIVGGPQHDGRGCTGDQRAVLACGLACGQDLGGELADGDSQRQL